MADHTERSEGKEPVKRGYQEPLLVRHEPLRNITGQLKSGEKPTGNEKAPALNEKFPLDET